MRARAIKQHTGQKLRLVGHSLGGMLSLSVAQGAPDLIDRVVLLGSTLRMDNVRAHPVTMSLMENLKLGQHDLVARKMRPSCATGHCLCPFSQSLATPLKTSVPVFSIYSPNDGVVSGDSCAHDDPDHNDAVDATHIGLMYNVGSYQALARRLAQTL